MAEFCKKCNTGLGGEFCSNCGQKARLERINGSYIKHEKVYDIFNIYLEQHPILELPDIQAALLYASLKIKNTVVIYAA